MFLECEKLRHVNLSSFKLDRIEEPSGMFINNPSLEAVDLGDCSDINQVLQIFPSESNNMENLKWIKYLSFKKSIYWINKGIFKIAV